MNSKLPDGMNLGTTYRLRNAAIVLALPSDHYWSSRPAYSGTGWKTGKQAGFVDLSKPNTTNHRTTGIHGASGTAYGRTIHSVNSTVVARPHICTPPPCICSTQQPH